MCGLPVLSVHARSQALYVLVAPSLKLKRRIPLDEVAGIEVSNLKDGVIVVRRDGRPDGDLIMIHPTGSLLVRRRAPPPILAHPSSRSLDPTQLTPCAAPCAPPCAPPCAAPYAAPPAPQIEIATRLYRQVEKATRKAPKLQIGKTISFDSGKGVGKITFEQSAEAPLIVFKPAPPSKLDCTCTIPADVAAAYAPAGRR